MCSRHKLDIEELDIENNPYYKDNPKNYVRLLDLVNDNPFSYHRILCKVGGKKFLKSHPEYKSEYCDLYAWILRIKPECLNDDVYRLATICYWIIFGLTDFPVCDVCGKRSRFIGKNVRSLFLGYHSWCSLTCKANSNFVKDKIRNTNLERSGFEYPA